REDTTREGIGEQRPSARTASWDRTGTAGSSPAGGPKARGRPTTSSNRPGASLGRLGAASADDVTTAATRAAAAQKQWARTTPAERAAVLRRAGALWAEHAEEISDWIIRESGAIPAKAGLEVSSAEQICYESSALPSHPKGQVLTSN